MRSLPKLSPTPLVELPAPFDDLDFLFEVKFDGFRALAYVEDGHCESRLPEGAHLQTLPGAVPVHQAHELDATLNRWRENRLRR